SASSLLGAYRIPNARVVARSVYTNTSPSGHVRAPSGPQTSFATESALDSLARHLQIDPLDLRMKNALGDGEAPPSGHGVLRNVGLGQCVETTRGWMHEKLGARQANEGVGVALALWALHNN